MPDDIIPALSAIEKLFCRDGLRLLFDTSAMLELEKVYLQLVPCDDIQLDIDQDWDYDKLLEECKEILIKHRKSDDALLRGYRIAKDNSIASKVYSSSSSFPNTLIRSHPWRLLHSIIGNEEMAQVLLNHNGFLKRNFEFLQLFGKTADRYASSKPKSRHLYTLNSSLYINYSQAKRHDPIPSSRKKLIQKIFSQRLETVSNYQKFESKVKQFAKLMATLLANHQKFAYFKCFDEICRERDPQNISISSALPKEQVIKFCSVVFDSIFPKDIYGCTHNKSVILRNLSFLVLKEKGVGLDIVDLKNNIKLKSVKWLGKGSQKRWNKQDYETRNDRMGFFISWLFSEFFPNLLGSFFHITHVSSSKELLYFRHSTWSRISNEFFQKYKSENFIDIAKTSSAHKDQNFNMDCQARIMPKRDSGYRVINVPLRGSDPVKRKTYIDYIKKEVRPTRQILSQLRFLKESKFSRVSSVSDLPLLLGEFKSMLCSQHNGIPLLYFLKFDVKECYDNLPQEKIKTCVSELISLNEIYYLTTKAKVDLVGDVVRNTKHLHTMDNVSSASKETMSSGFLSVGGDLVLSLRGDEIKAIVETQLDLAYTVFQNKVYKRKKGVFQGLHLSSLFCDLVYDKLVEEKFGFLDDRASLVLRMADDFLVISSDKSSILKARKMIDEGFDEYGIKVNKLKTFLNFSNVCDDDQNESKDFSFCGFKISTSNLTVLKQYEFIGMSHFRSHKNLTQKLAWLFKIRLTGSTLRHRSLNDNSTILKQVFILATSTAKSYQKSVVKMKPIGGDFLLFFSEIVEASLQILKTKRTNLFFFQKVKDSIIQAFLITFKRRNTKLCELIQLLEKMLE